MHSDGFKWTNKQVNKHTKLQMKKLTNGEKKQMKTHTKWTINKVTSKQMNKQTLQHTNEQREKVSNILKHKHTQISQMHSKERKSTKQLPTTKRIETLSIRIHLQFRFKFKFKFRLLGSVFPLMWSNSDGFKWTIVSEWKFIQIWFQVRYFYSKQIPLVDFSYDKLKV